MLFCIFSKHYPRHRNEWAIEKQSEPPLKFAQVLDKVQKATRKIKKSELRRKKEQEKEQRREQAKQNLYLPEEEEKNQDQDRAPIALLSSCFNHLYIEEYDCLPRDREHTLTKHYEFAVCFDADFVRDRTSNLIRETIVFMKVRTRPLQLS